MSIEIASVVIPTSLNLSGFNSGLAALERTKVNPIEVEVRINTASLERDRKALEASLAKPLVLTLEVDDTGLIDFEKRLARQSPYKVNVSVQVDTTGLDDARQQINKSIRSISSVKIKVDDSELYGANKHIESKRTHIKELNHWGSQNPLRIAVDSKPIDDISTKVQAVEKRIKGVNQSYKTTASVAKDSEKLQRYEPKIISPNQVSNQIEKAFSQAKPRLGSNIFGSILRGGLEKIGGQLTSGFSEGLSNSINEAVSGSIGSFDLLGRSIFDKFIPGLVQGLKKAPIAKALGSAISGSKVGQAAKGVLQTTKGIIGEDEIAIEQRVNKSRRKSSITDRNKVASKEFGLEYQEVLSRSGLSDIERSQTEKQIQNLTKQRSKAQKELESFMSMTLDEKVLLHFSNQINSTSNNIKRLKDQQLKLEAEAQKLVDKIDAGGTLTKEEQSRKGVIESQYQSLDKNISVAQKNLSGLTERRQNIAAASDDEKEALTGQGIKARMSKVSEVEKQIEAAKKRLETIATQKSEIERLLQVVGINSAGKLEGARALRDDAILQKKTQIATIKTGNKEQIDKGRQVLAASQVKIDKAKQQLQQAIADSEDNYAEGLKKFISDEEKRQVKIQAGINELEDVIAKLDANEADFIARANKSVPDAELGVIQAAGIDKSTEQLGKEVAFGNVENISKEYKKLLGKLQNLEYESNEEMKAAVDRMNAMNASIGQYEKEAEQALKVFKSKGVTPPQGQAKTASAQGKKATPEQAVPQAYRSIADEVAKASGVKLPESKIPAIKAWTPKQIQSLAAKGISAEAAYVADKNLILVKQEQLDQLHSGQLTPELVENLVHELRHSVQNAFGEIDPHQEQRSAVDLMRPNAEEMKRIGNLIEVSTSNAYESSSQEESFIRKSEQDAYTFALRNTQGIYNKVARPAKVQRIEQVGGAGGYKLLGNIDKLQSQQMDKLSKSLQSATYDVSGAEAKLDAKFNALRKAAEKYINQIANIDELSDVDLTQLDSSIGYFADNVAQMAEGLADNVEKELLSAAKLELTQQLQGGATSKKELQKLAKSFNIGLGGTKEDITKRLLANVNFNDLRAAVPQLKPHQRAAISQADVLQRQPDSIQSNISESIKASREQLDKYKQGLDFNSPLPNLEEDYNLVLELLGRNLENDVKKYLQGAKLQIGNLRKATQTTEETLITNPNLGQLEEFDITNAQLAGRSINPLQAARQRLRSVTNKGQVRKASKANVKAGQALQHVFEAGLNKQEREINQAIAEFEKAANAQYEAAVKAVEQRLANYDAAILKADEMVFHQMQPENQAAINASQQNITANNRLLSEQEQKGNVVNYQRLSIPQPTNADTGEFKQLIGEALGDFFSGVADRVRKQAQILQNQVPSLMTDLSVSAIEAGGDEGDQLNTYRAKLDDLMKESQELSSKSTLSPEEVKRLADINKEVQSVFDTFGRAVPQVNKFFDALLTGGDIAGQTGSALKGLLVGFLTFKSLTVVIGLIKQFAPVLIESATAMESLERRFGFVSGSFAEGAKNLTFVRSEVKRLGTDVKASMEGFTSLAGSTRDTSLEGEATKQIFSGVSQASTVYDLNAEQQGRVFAAVQQMASKGKVSSEELRQQLGESLPGAFQIAARSMGVTTSQLNKMLEQGQVLSEDFLPKFAQQLSSETSSGVAGAANSSVSALIGFNNTVFETQAALGKQLLPVRNLGLQALGAGLAFVKENADILMSGIQFLALYMGVNAVGSILKLVGGLKILGGQALFSAGGLQILGGALKGALVSAAPMLAAFVAFKIVGEIFENLSFSFSDAGGSIRSFADTSKKGLGDFTKALKEARGEQEALTGGITRADLEKKASNKDKNDSFLWNITGTNFVRNNILKPLINPREALGKQADESISIGDRFKAFGKRFGDIGKPKAIKELDDKVAASRDAVKSSEARIGLSKGSEVQGIIKEVQEIDKQLRATSVKRRGVITTNPKDVETIKRLKEEESTLLKNREKLYKPVGVMQSQYQADVDGLKAALEEYDQLRKTGNIDDKTYAQETGILKNQLDKAEKAQREFTKAIGENIDAVSLLAKQFKDIADRVADASSAAQMSANAQKAGLYNNANLSQEQRAFKSEQIDTSVIEAQAKESLQAVQEQVALLMTPENLATLQAYGANENTGAAQLKTLAERAGDDSPDSKLFDQMAVLKEQQLQTSDLQAQVAQRRAETQQKLRDLNKQVEEYYRGIARQAAESEIQLAKQMSELDNQQFANQINRAMLGAGDNIVSQFVGSLLDAINQIAQAADSSFDAQSQILQAQNAFEDTFRGGEELKRQLPKLEIQGDLPSLSLELDLNTVASNTDIKALNGEIKKGVSATEDLNAVTLDFNSSVANSSDLIRNSTSATNDLESSVVNVSGAIDTNIQGVDSLNSSVDNTTSAAGYLQSQIDSNTMSIDANDVKMQSVGGSIDANTQKTALTTEQSQKWWAELGIVEKTTISVQAVFTAIGTGIMDVIAKTVDWFKTFANNIPILNQVGQTLGSFGSAIGEGASGLAQQAGQQLDRFTNWAGGGGKVTERYRTGLISGQEYGASRDGGSRKHAGQDIDISGNQEAQSFIGGIVTKVVNNPNAPGYGSYVDIYNKSLGVVERIAEVLTLNVKVGQEIKAGQAIGRGETNTGVFHYEIRTPDANGQGGYGYQGTQDPIKFYEKLGIAKREGNDIKILKGMNAGQSLKASEHGVGDGHNHFGEDDIKKANQGMAGTMESSSKKMLASMGGSSAIPAMSLNGNAIGSGQGKTAVSRSGGGATIPRLGAGYSSLESLASELSTNKYFNPSSPEGRARMAVALGIGGSEVYSKGSTAKDYFTRRGGTDNNMLGFGQYNLAYHAANTNTPEKYKNFIGSQLAGEKLLPNSQQGMDYGKGLAKAVAQGTVQNGQQLIAWMKANKLGGSNWQGVDDGWGRVPELADKLVAYLKTGQGQSVAPVASGGGGQVQGGGFTPSAPMKVWTPDSLAKYSISQINSAQDTAKVQRDAQQAAALRQSVVQAETGTIGALQKAGQSLVQVQKQLRLSGYETRDLSEDISKMNLEAMGALSSADKRKQALTEIERQYRDTGEKVNEKMLEVENRQMSAKAILEQPGGVLTPATREKFNKLLSMPIADDLKMRLQEAMTTGVFGDKLRDVLQKSVSQGDQELATLQSAAKALEAGKKGALKAAQERFDFEEKARANAAKFELESLSIATLQARLEQLKAKAERDPFGGAKAEIPAMEALIALRQNTLDYEKQIDELEKKKRDKTINEKEADDQIKELKAKKAVTEQTVKENRAYQEIVNSREKSNRDREIGLQAAKDELAVQKQQLETLKALPSTDLSRNQIPQLEYQVSLAELQIKLQEDIAAVNEAVFKDPSSKAAGDTRIAKLKEEFGLAQKNLEVRLKQSTVEQELAQKRAIIGIREQELGYAEQLLEAQSRSIELGRTVGDTLGGRYELQTQQQMLGFEKSILDVKELALQSGKSAEEIAGIEAKLRTINDIKLDNINAEMKKAFDDRAFAVNQRMGESNNSALSARQSLMSTYGFTQEASRIGKEIAVNQQSMDFTSQKRDLEEFIKTNAVAADKAALLRTNLESVNDVKFKEIAAQFNPLKGVIDSSVGALKGGFKSLIKEGKVDFDSFFDGILDSIADFLSNMIVEQLMGFLSPNKDKKKGGGMFPDATAKPQTQEPDFTSLLGIGDDPMGALGKSPVQPMFVNVVNAADLGFAKGANNIVPFSRNDAGGGFNFSGLGGGSIFGNQPDYVSATTDIFGDLGGIFSPGLPPVSMTNPFPVNVQGAKPNIFSSLMGGLGGGGGIGGAIGGIASAIGGGGGFGSIISSLLPMVGSLFGGIFASGGVIGSGKGKNDDQLIMAQRGEGVLSHKGMATIGGAVALNAINRGTYRVPKFTTGGVVGGEYGTNGADQVVTASAEREAARANGTIKVETQVINGVEYATVDQVREAAAMARSQGARDGATYISEKMSNSATWRNRHGIR